jgi:hypothetical protein
MKRRPDQVTRTQFPLTRPVIIRDRMQSRVGTITAAIFSRMSEMKEVVSGCNSPSTLRKCERQRTSGRRFYH